MRHDRVTPTAYLTVAGLALTAAVVALPFARFAYRLPEAHVLIDTAVGMVALLLAYLLYGRYTLTGDRSDWILAGFLAVSGLANVVLSAIAHAVSTGDRTFASWAPVSGRLLAAFGFCIVAFRPATERESPRRRGWLLALDTVAATAVAAGVVAATLRWLPSPVDPGLSPLRSSRPVFVGAGLTVGVHTVTALLYAAATVGFSRKSTRGLDTWFGASCALQSIAALNYLLFPSLYSEWLYTGDFFRIAAYAVLVAGAGSEIRTYWNVAAEGAAIDERRRVAREFHDGLAQELALVTSYARHLATRGDDPVARELAGAADRALDEARLAISALTVSRGETLASAVRRAAEDAAARHGVALDADIDGVGRSGDRVHEALVRICREAITNAARHSGVRRVRVRMMTDERGGLTMQVSDDGRGFDPDAPRPRGSFGLTSMTERAEAVGGSLHVESAEGRGTTVEVRLP
jgi:signal transduction histidine kinase